MADNNNRVNTSTQIRNLYSDGMSYLNISFFNTNLSFKFYPFLGRSNVGRSNYDLNNGLNTTVNFEGAFMLHNICTELIEGKRNDVDLTIPCAQGAQLMLQAKPNGNNVDVIFSIMKNNITIPHKFATMTYTTKNVNGQPETVTVQTGLGAFMKTIEGYLTGINADRHLDKMTEDYVKSLQNDQQQNNNQNNNRPNNYGNNNYRNNNNGGYKKQYNNNYKRPYNNQNGNNFPNNQQNNGWQPPKQQDLATYQIPN